MTSLPDMLEWVRSHAGRLRRPGYEPPNHLANGRVRFMNKTGQIILSLQLDSKGEAPDYLDPAPHRVEIYGGNNELLYTEEAA